MLRHTPCGRLDHYSAGAFLFSFKSPRALVLRALAQLASPSSLLFVFWFSPLLLFFASSCAAFPACRSSPFSARAAYRAPTSPSSCEPLLPAYVVPLFLCIDVGAFFFYVSAPYPCPPSAGQCFWSSPVLFALSWPCLCPLQFAVSSFAFFFCLSCRFPTPFSVLFCCTFWPFSSLPRFSVLLRLFFSCIVSSSHGFAVAFGSLLRCSPSLLCAGGLRFCGPWDSLASPGSGSAPLDFLMLKSLGRAPVFFVREDVRASSRHLALAPDQAAYVYPSHWSPMLAASSAFCTVLFRFLACNSFSFGRMRLGFWLHTFSLPLLPCPPSSPSPSCWAVLFLHLTSRFFAPAS